MHPAIAYALASAALFGASTPLAKLLLGEASPLVLAGLLYLGGGCGLAAWLAIRRIPAGAGRAAPIVRADWPWLAGAIAAGGVAGPALLMFGLARTEGSAASLLLNLEAVLTAVMAWVVFRENVDRRVFLGMCVIVAGGVLLSWDQMPRVGSLAGPLLVASACFAWAVDNNLTRRVSGGDAATIACLKGLAAGSVNLGLALGFGAELPGAATIVAAGAVGFAGYGVSLALFIVALRYLGTARTSAYFSVAPFFGAGLAFAVLAETPSPAFWAAAALMALGVWLHVSERHEHLHVHEAMEHSHEHEHDAHHQHAHEHPVVPGTRHTHSHRHERLVHRHPHYPDLHHRHRH